MGGGVECCVTACVCMSEAVDPPPPPGFVCLSRPAATCVDSCIDSCICWTLSRGANQACCVCCAAADVAYHGRQHVVVPDGLCDPNADCLWVVCVNIPSVQTNFRSALEAARQHKVHVVCL